MTKVEGDSSSRGGPQLFAHLESQTSRSLKTFTPLGDCIYANKYLADSGQEEVMTCECKVKWDSDSNQNLACGHDSDCINRLTSIECLQDNNSCGDDCQNMRFQRHQYASVSVIQTELKGFGLRIDASVDQGTFIYEYIGEVIDEAKFRKRMVNYDEQGIKHFYFMMLQKGEFIDATMKGCLARFCNHSCNPNCYVDKWVVGNKLRMGIFAKRNLIKGEEITFDYNVDRYGAQAQPCYCGEPNCIGFIGGKTQTEAASKLPQIYVDALGITSSDDEEWYTQTSASKVSKSKRRRGETDEDYVDSIETRALPESQVSKVMSSLVQCKEPWLVAKLLSRIQLASSDAHVQRLVMKMHGYQILGTVLREHEKNDGIVVLILKILLSWPRLTKNKISSSKIESTVEDISKSENDTAASKLANELVCEWNSLQMAYRIPRRERPLVKPDPQVKEEPKSKSSTEQQEDNNNNNKQQMNGSGRLIKNQIMAKKRPLLRPIVRKQQLPRSLPAGWSQAEEANGRTYYYNRERNISQWEFPVETPSTPQQQQAAVVVESNKVDLQRIIEEANRQIAGKQAALQQEASLIKIKQEREKLEKERIALSKLKRKEKIRKKKKEALKKKASDPQVIKKLLTKTFAEYVPNQVKKVSGNKLSRESIKRHSKDIVKILVDKEMRPGHVVKDPKHLASEKRDKVKEFIDIYMGKVIARHGGSKEKEEEEEEEDEDEDVEVSDGVSSNDDDDDDDDEDVSSDDEGVSTPPPPPPALVRNGQENHHGSSILHNVRQGGDNNNKRSHKVTFADDVDYQESIRRQKVKN